MTQEIIRIEIISSYIGSAKIVEKLDEIKVAGYSLFPEVYGKGKHGYHLGDELSDVFKNTMILILVDESRLQAIIDAVKPLVSEYGGICSSSKVELLCSS